MKLYSCILALVLASNASAFNPTFGGRMPSSSLRAVDKTMKGIDADGSFDPTEGEHPALARNNLGEVWNQQVSSVV